jgi:hypothetical protein
MSKLRNELYEKLKSMCPDDKAKVRELVMSSSDWPNAGFVSGEPEAIFNLKKREVIPLLIHVRRFEEHCSKSIPGEDKPANQQLGNSKRGARKGQGAINDSAVLELIREEIKKGTTVHHACEMQTARMDDKTAQASIRRWTRKVKEALDTKRADLLSK